MVKNANLTLDLNNLKGIRGNNFPRKGRRKASPFSLKKNGNVLKRRPILSKIIKLINLVFKPKKR